MGKSTDTYILCYKFMPVNIEYIGPRWQSDKIYLEMKTFKRGILPDCVELLKIDSTHQLISIF
jgi:hypothetical protein